MGFDLQYKYYFECMAFHNAYLENNWQKVEVQDYLKLKQVYNGEYVNKPCVPLIRKQMDMYIQVLECILLQPISKEYRFEN